MNSPRSSIDDDLPPQPDMPDCCNGGCAVCVLDGWAEEVQAWRKQVEQIRQKRAETAAAAAKDGAQTGLPGTPES
jgi:hypothetical protein